MQLFFRNNGELSYCRNRHYTGRQKNKPQSEYHQQSLSSYSEKTYEMPKETYTKISNKSGHIGQKISDDIEKAESSTILKKSWPSSLVHIEHQP